VPFTEEDLRAVIDSLELPVEYVQAMLLDRGKLAYFKADEGRHREGEYRCMMVSRCCLVLTAAVLIYRSPVSVTVSSTNWLVALSWDRAQRYGQVVIIGTEDDEREKMLGALQDTLFNLTNPFNFLIVILRQTIEGDYEGIKRHGIVFKGIEDWMQTFSVQSSVSETTESIMGMITRSVNRSSSGLSFHEMRLESCSRSLNYIATIRQHFDVSDKVQSDIQIPSRGSWDIIAHSQNDIEHLLLEVHLYQKIADSALAVVGRIRSSKNTLLTFTPSKMSNILMHQDNHTNKILAEASLEQAKAAKEDSSAMMVLALLGTIFLPATFTSVSSC
jgi:hypothetical protein